MIVDIITLFFNIFSTYYFHTISSHKLLIFKMSLYFSEVVDHACSITTLLQGETMAGISKDMDTHSYRTPLGVCAGISP